MEGIRSITKRSKNEKILKNISAIIYACGKSFGGSVKTINQKFAENIGKAFAISSVNLRWKDNRPSNLKLTYSKAGSKKEIVDMSNFFFSGMLMEMYRKNINLKKTIGKDSSYIVDISLEEN